MKAAAGMGAALLLSALLSVQPCAADQERKAAAGGQAAARDAVHRWQAAARNASRGAALPGDGLRWELPSSIPDALHKLHQLTVLAVTHASPERLAQVAADFWETFKPGGRLHPTYILEHQWHLVFEAALMLVLAYMLFQRSFKPSSKQEKPLTEQEVDELCEEWLPEPLCPPLPDAQHCYEPPVISSAAGVWVVANGKRALNMASLNFLGVAGDPNIREVCTKTVEKYGVGSCGPRGFYGTIDVHLELEERLARFMATEESIIYSYDLATVPSVLPAFANAKDIIVCDEMVSYPTQNGAHLSRASVRTFKHNDVADLRRVLDAVADEDRRIRKPLNRRFIVVEGIYAHTGELAPLADIYKLKEQYKYRLVVDESLALGVLGARGRGACEHWGLHPGDVEIVAASLGNALGSIGGFCAGAREIVDHQRLSGLGYCFSASLPPFLASAAVGALDVLERDAAALLPALAANAALLRRRLAEVPGVLLMEDTPDLLHAWADASEGIEVVGGVAEERSPVVHVRLTAQPPEPAEAEALLQRVADAALKRDGVLFVVSRVSALDRARSAPSLRLAVTAAHMERDIFKAVSALSAAVRDATKAAVKSPPRAK